ncbi:hypothetical protein BJV78DRAFT_1159394 [Lactifluus subvellereus]|nr:hypothetical protein BJV78DRAFT_1159394 [Lactifluus subvellereus]
MVEEKAMAEEAKAEEAMAKEKVIAEGKVTACSQSGRTAVMKAEMLGAPSSAPNHRKQPVTVHGSWTGLYCFHRRLEEKKKLNYHAYLARVSLPLLLRMSSDIPPRHPTTRSKNANQHPGAIVAPKRRRTKAEKAHDDEVQRVIKEQRAAKKKEAILCVVRLEDEMAVGDNNACGAHPRHRHELTGSESEAELPPKKRAATRSSQASQHAMQEGSKDAPNKKVSKGKQKVAGRKATPVTHKDPEPEEGDETDTPKGASRATNLKTKDRVPVTKESEFTSTDSDAEEVVRQKMGRKLKRTYAMREIASSDHDADAQDSDYKSATGASGTEVDRELSVVSDNEATPRPKKKAKPAVREAIRANRVELAGGNMKNRSGSSVAESLITIGKPSGRVKNWIAHIPQHRQTMHKLFNFSTYFVHCKEISEKAKKFTFMIVPKWH